MSESVREILDDSIGSSGSRYLTDTTAVTPTSGFVFFCIIPQEDIVIDSMIVSSSHADYTGETLLAGIPVYTECASIKLTSGKCTIYEKVSG